MSDIRERIFRRLHTMVPALTSLSWDLSGLAQDLRRAQSEDRKNGNERHTVTAPTRKSRTRSPPPVAKTSTHKSRTESGLKTKGRTPQTKATSTKAAQAKDARKRKPPPKSAEYVKSSSSSGSSSSSSSSRSSSSEDRSKSPPKESGPESHESQKGSAPPPPEPKTEGSTSKPEKEPKAEGSTSKPEESQKPAKTRVVIPLGSAIKSTAFGSKPAIVVDDNSSDKLAMIFANMTDPTQIKSLLEMVKPPPRKRPAKSALKQESIVYAKRMAHLKMKGVNLQPAPGPREAAKPPVKQQAPTAAELMKEVENEEELDYECDEPH